MSHLLALILSGSSTIAPNELLRFPPAAVVACHRDIVSRNLQRLKILRCIDTRDQVALAVDDASYSLACWEALYRTQQASRTDPVGCLSALAALRHLLRDGAYRAGAMPPLHPSWGCVDDSICHVRGELR